MSDVELKPARGKSADVAAQPVTRKANKRRFRIFPVLITLAAVAIAAGQGRAMWNAYMVAPWTRDGMVRAYVVTMAPEVAGHIVELPVIDNKFVHKGDLLVGIDPTDYRIALDAADAAVLQAKANAGNAQAMAERRRKLSDLAETIEDRQIHEANALATTAQYQQAIAQRDRAKVNLDRTQIRSPVNGWVTNLLAQQGDYANVAQNVISLVDADSYWVDAYFEETQLVAVRDGDPAKIKLMGNSQIVDGEVAGVARGINVPNAQPNQQGLATVNPIFTWVRLAQRVPVHIRIKHVPDGVRLVAGLTATVQVEPTMTSQTDGAAACSPDFWGSPWTYLSRLLQRC